MNCMSHVLLPYLMVNIYFQYCRREFAPGLFDAWMLASSTWKLIPKVFGLKAPFVSSYIKSVLSMAIAWRIIIRALWTTVQINNSIHLQESSVVEGLIPRRIIWVQTKPDTVYICKETLTPNPINSYGNMKALVTCWVSDRSVCAWCE